VVLLLDTHVLMWALDMPERLPKAIVDEIEAPETAVYFSAASIWEIAIKTSFGKVTQILAGGDRAGGQGDGFCGTSRYFRSWRQGGEFVPAPPRSV